MIFGQFRLDVNESNAFVVGCEESGDAILIDAAEFPPRMAAFLKAHQLKLTKVLITHDHYDHTGGLEKVLADYPATVYSGKDSVAGYATTQVKGGEEIRVGNTVGRVIALPGHTHFQVGLVLPGMVFTGDALFAGSVGGTFSDGDQQHELVSIEREVFSLPDDTLIHTGHGPSSTVGIEKRFNPFFV